MADHLAASLIVGVCAWRTWKKKSKARSRPITAMVANQTQRSIMRHLSVEG